MNDTIQSLRHKIESVTDLGSVVRTMKALAASSIWQYERSVLALNEYYLAVSLGLTNCIDQAEGFPELTVESKQGLTGAILFGSDQGLVGQFNDSLADFASDHLDLLPGKKYVWLVGERLHDRFSAADSPVRQVFHVPNSVYGITPLIGEILTSCNAKQLYIFHNRPKTGALYEPFVQRLLPLDETWKDAITQGQWPTSSIPEVLGRYETAMRSLIREYLFVSLFRSCAESLASENACRLASMQRAEKNIDEMLKDLRLNYNHLRQRVIDEELFDVIAGFEALSGR